MSNRVIVFLLATLAGAYGLPGWRAKQENDGHERPPAIEVLRAGAKRLLSGAGERKGLIPAESESFVSLATGKVMGQRVELGPGNDFRLISVEWNPFSKAWEEDIFAYTASFPVIAVCARQPYELYLSMRDGVTSEVIVEKWVFAPQNGARVAYRPSTLNPIGTPVPYQAPLGAIIGGTYVPMSQRPDMPSPSVAEVYRGSAMSTVDGLVIDPDCRFLLVASLADAALYQIPLSGSGAGVAVVIGDYSSIPALALTSAVFPLQHEAEGRLYLLETLFVEGLRTILRDQNNDGMLDSTAVYWPWDYESLGYAGEVWIDDFQSYGF